MDGRKRRYVPLSLTFAHGDTGSYLLKQLGRDGLLTWVCLIAAAKRHDPEGEFEWYGEDDAWRQLGLGDPYTPGFTFEEFLAVTGRAKQTRKTRLRGSGRFQHLSISRWSEWNKGWKRGATDRQDTANTLPTDRQDTAFTKTGDGQDADGTLTGDGQNPCSDDESTNEVPANNLAGTEEIPTPELEVELELEVEEEQGAKAPLSSFKNPTVPELAVYNHWRTAFDKNRANYTQPSEKRLKAIRKALKHHTSGELQLAIDGLIYETPQWWINHHEPWVIFRDTERIEHLLELEEAKPLPVPSNGGTVKRGMSPADIVAYTKGRA